MASLMSTAIIAACVGTHGNYNQACNKALDAGTRQVGIRQDVDKAEDMTVSYINGEMEKRLTKGEKSVLGAAGFVYRTSKEKVLRFRAPTMGLCDSITNEVTPNSYNVKFSWSFR